MHPLFEITASDIQNLNDEQARELVARLCKAELRSKGVGTWPVTWGGDQRAKDGGVDVRVEITPAIGVSGYVPKDATAYQVKAEGFSPAKIPGEMAPKDLLRPAIIELDNESGAYVIVSTRDSCSDSSLRKRKMAMAKCIQSHGLANSLHLDFYDSRKMADWASNYPSVLVWLRSLLGNPIAGWRPYGAWAYKETSAEDEYLLDDKINVFVPNADEAIPATDAINRVREELGKSGASVRIVGLSGVGKTRLVQALFDDRIQTSVTALSQENVLYTDLSDNPTPQPIAMLEGLNQDGADCIVVVDNCGQDIHRRLTEIAKYPGSKIRIVTVEYDIRDDLPADTVCYRLEGSSGEVIGKLLKRHYQTLSELDIDKIVEFSDGNARVAFALASTSEIKGDLAQLRDDELFKRLFIQKHSASDELQRCAEAASLLYSFDVEDASEKSELAILAAVAEVTITTFYRNISDLQKRGLVQARGKWRAVLPHAIANRLAVNAVQSNHPSLLVQRFVNDASERVARSFSRRLGYLHESKHAQQIVEEWLQPEGLLGDIPKLDALKREMLENIAPVNQRAALNALLRAVDTADFISLSNLSRAHSARLLRSLAYEPDLFDDAASALLKFALEEPGDHSSNAIRDILQSLFYAHLSGTLAPPEQRAAFVRKLVFAGDDASHRLALVLLRAGLESHHFSSHYGFDFGALRRSYGWYPRTLKEIQEWYLPFIRIAVDLGKNATPLSTDARALLGCSFRGLWGDARMCHALTDAAREFAAVDGWPDGWIGIRNTLHWDKEHLDSASMEQLKNLEKELAPRDLLAKINAKVFSRGAFGADLDDECEHDESEPKSSAAWYYKAQDEAEMLGKAAALDTDALADLTPYVSNVKSTDKSWHFGFGMGQMAASPQEILDRIKQVIPTIKKEGVNTIFIRGLVSGWNKTEPSEVSAFLECAVTDSIWGDIFPELQIAAGIDDAAHERLIRCITIGKAPAWQFKYLGFGRATDALSVEQIASLLTPLAIRQDGGLAVAIDVLCMVIHCLDKKSAAYKAELQTYCSKFVSEIDWAKIDLDNHNFSYHLENITEFALANATQNKEICDAMKSLIQFERSSARHYPRRLGKILLPFFREYPDEALNACYVADDDGSYDTALRMLAVQLEDHGETAVGAVPETQLIEWCKLSPTDRCIFAAQTCKLFESNMPNGIGDEGILRISSVAKSVLTHAPDKKIVVDAFMDRFTGYCRNRSATMRHKLPLLDQLNANKDVSLQAIIEEAKISLSRIIAREERREQERERSRTSSFE